MRNFVQTGRKIVAIGRNFMDHAKELNNAIPKAPFFFLKPTSSYVQEPHPIELPKGCDVHYEVELGVVIGKDGRDISAKDAENYIAGYALGIDMSARNIQGDAKSKGLPWSASKGFDTFCPISSFIEKQRILDAHNIQLWLKVDGVLKQNGNTSDMMFKIPQLIENVSSIMKLQEGDLILTGTPKGVGPVFAGQTLTAGLKIPDGATLTEVSFPVVTRGGNFIYHAP
ncbi:hypothetical protein DSO57_1029792 [Entomophthora muscae]|uniref:Uncharacterized protein n=1 Tax=Entomophthora muscae TaxID=34485 RepID=A0ACC2SDY1_9FUNG|nr:hypothetical protein DSO57_1029792 [Entomophthora muscae]